MDCTKWKSRGAVVKKKKKKKKTKRKKSKTVSSVIFDLDKGGRKGTISIKEEKGR